MKTEMKKIVALILTTLLVIGLCSCNYNIIDTKYEFNYAYINYGDRTEKLEIKSWAEDDTTFTLTTKDGRVICSDQQNIILVKE